MSLQLSNSLFFRHNKSHFKNPCSSYNRVSASLDTGVERVASANSASLCFEESRERIVKLIQKPEFSISTYDTAWVAMVPSPHSTQEEPCFPDCVNWLIDNQCHDGSWARPHHHSLLRKDVLSSTLACVLALKRWGVGAEQIDKGIHFIELNITSANEKDQINPVGFDILFPGMLEYGIELSLNLHLEPKILNDLIHRRKSELKRCYKSPSANMDAYMAYLSEGMGRLQDWKSVMRYQRRNGSLFNSPSTTAAACIFHNDARCLDYLQSALKKFGNAVPAVHPLDIYSQLSTVDNLQKLGIGQYFRSEIRSVLDETFRCWLQDEEEIFMDASTCALAFRILRMNGYDVTSDPVTKILEEEYHSSFLGGESGDIYRSLESYRATEVIFPDEAALEKQNSRLRRVLEQELSSSTHSCEHWKSIEAEVQCALQNPFYAVMERIANRRKIEHYNLDNTRILKTSFCSPNLANKDFLLLSLADFNECQKLHRKELEEIERWVAENRLDELKFARRKSAYCYFSAAATFFSPDLSDARMSWAKNSVLTTVVDDFFDVGGSVEELKNLIQLVEGWEVDVDTECSSQNVLIIFSALKSTICEIGDKASKMQERCVTKHIIDIWLDLLYSMLKETEWAGDNSIPTIEEYMNNAYVSFALGPIVLPTLYLVGPNVSEEMVHHSEYHSLFKLMSTCGRLLNDIRSYERERKQGKLTAVVLYKTDGGGDATEEVAIAELKKLIDNRRRELLKLVVEGGTNSVLPRACKDLFWHMSTVLHLFYSKDDGFSSEDLIKVVKNIIYEPIVLDEL